MQRANPSLTAALTVSLLAHGLGLSGLAWWYIEHAPRPRTAALDKYQVWVQQMDKSAPAPIPPDPATAQQSPRAAVKPKPKVFNKPAESPRDDSGEATGAGTANRSTAGEKPMQANAGLEQADLMRQAKKFSESAFMPASAGDASEFSTPKQVSPPKGVMVPDAVTSAKPSPSVKTSQTPAEAPVALKLVGPARTPQPHAVASGTSAAPRAAAKVPLAQLPAPVQRQREIVGHKATVSDTESIALSKINGGVFRAGRLEARKGLKVKTTIPRFGLASEADFNSLGDVPTLIRARVDVDGNVLDVDVVESSGSANIDQDRRLAVWNWTLEPQKDKDGHVTDDQWTIALE